MTLLAQLEPQIGDGLRPPSQRVALARVTMPPAYSQEASPEYSQVDYHEHLLLSWPTIHKYFTTHSGSNHKNYTNFFGGWAGVQQINCLTQAQMFQTLVNIELQGAC